MEISATKPKIEISELDIVYNKEKANEVRVLENIDLKIYPHEYVIIFGPSGCGKSTLLYAIAGFQKPTDGKITVESQDINAMRKKEKADYRRMRIGMIFQSFYLVPTLSILDNVCLPQTFLGVEAEKRKARGLELLEYFGIKNQAEKFPAELSGGQKQRVAIARALMNNPDVIIADEPVGNLDSKSAYNVMSILRDLNEKDKKTIILVTHDPTHLSFGNKVVHMQDGKVVKIEEVVERKEAVLKGEEEVIVKKEMVAPEIQMFMKSFRNFSPSQLGMLLIPFKAQEFLSHILFDVPEGQLQEARNKLQEVISGRFSIENLEELLDKDEEKGGLGWDKRKVKKFVGRVKAIMDISHQMDLENLEKTSSIVAGYLLNLFKLELNDEQKFRLAQMVRLRLDNKLSIVEFRKGLDRPVKDRGLGMDKRVANKVARELEIVMLARYSA